MGKEANKILKTKTKMLFKEHLELKFYGKNKYDTEGKTFDFNLGFEINMHYIALDLVIVGFSFWWRT